METQAELVPRGIAGDGLCIRLFGEIRVQRGANNILLPASKRTRALLGFLAATAKPQPRQTLCDLLWDGPDDPRAALRWSLTKLRPITNDAGIERLAADREHVSLSLADVEIDAGSVERLLRDDPEGLGISQLENASAQLQGEFLDGLDLPSCYRFHHWCLAERERWGAVRRRILALVLARLGDDPERALPYAHAMVAADPLSEASHSRLVALLSSLGRRKDAQEHYAYARDMLQREMGAPITGDLKAPANLQTIPAKEGMKVPVVHAADRECRPGSLPVPEPRLIGRAAEVQSISASINDLLAGVPTGRYSSLARLASASRGCLSLRPTK